jgi:hypothetical protein
MLGADLGPFGARKRRRIVRHVLLLAWAWGLSLVASATATSTPASTPAPFSQLGLLADHRSCAPSSSIWERTRRDASHASCFLLAQARANLMTRPRLALELARRVLQLSAQDGSARRIAAHAQFLLGDAAAAHLAFRAIEETDDGHEQPHIWLSHLWASAQVAVAQNDLARAHLRYRRLLLALDVWNEDESRAQILIEAAFTAWYLKADANEARSYLRRAGEEDAPLFARVRQALLLVLSADPQRARISEGLNEDFYWKMGWLLGVSGEDDEPTRLNLVLPAGAQHMLMGLLARTLLPARARLHWQTLHCSGAAWPAHSAALLGPNDPPSSAPTRRAS